MADERRRGRPQGPSSGRPSGGPGGKQGGRSGSGRGRPAGGPAGSSGSGDRRGGQGRDAGGRNRDGAHDRRGRGPRPDRRRDEDRTQAQREYDGPPLPDEVVAKDLDRDVRRALSSLPEKLADRVARHLVMAGALIAEDPELAHRHALAARARAQRVAVVREASGETAYAAGKFADALSDLRAARRMNGAVDYLPMMVDCERALGRPERALELASTPARDKLDEAGRAELAIVTAGARRDLGQQAEAVRLLEQQRLHSPAREPWVARLRYAYADALQDAGRGAEALEWFHRVLAVDGNEETDAVERIAALEGGDRER